MCDIKFVDICHKILRHVMQVQFSTVTAKPISLNRYTDIPGFRKATFYDDKTATTTRLTYCCSVFRHTYSPSAEHNLNKLRFYLNLFFQIFFFLVHPKVADIAISDKVVHCITYPTFKIIFSCGNQQSSMYISSHEVLKLFLSVAQVQYRSNLKSSQSTTDLSYIPEKENSRRNNRPLSMAIPSNRTNNTYGMYLKQDLCIQNTTNGMYLEQSLYM